MYLDPRPRSVRLGRMCGSLQGRAAGLLTTLAAPAGHEVRLDRVRGAILAAGERNPPGPRRGSIRPAANGDRACAGRHSPGRHSREPEAHARYTDGDGGDPNGRENGDDEGGSRDLDMSNERVDARLAVHDMDNLFVCSNAVFPSIAAVNPTLTLAALALRLAEHLSLRSDAPAEGARRLAHAGAGDRP